MKNNIKVIVICIISVTSYIYLYYFNVLSIVPFVFCLIISLIIQHSKYIKQYDSVYSYGVPVISYAVISLVGSILLLNYHTLYNSYFGPYGDDSAYFYTIKSLAEGGVPYKIPTSYELTLVPWYKLVTLLVGDPSMPSILPINWLFASIVIVLSVILMRVVVGGLRSILVPILSIMGNSIFLDSVSNLYRDGFGLIFFLGSIILAIKKRYLAASVLAVGCSTVRLATGGIAIFSVALVLAGRHLNMRYYSRMIVFITLSIIVILALDYQWHIGGYMRSLLVESNKNVTIISLAEQRANALINKGEQASTVSRLYNMGTVGYLVAPIATLLAPIEFVPLVQNFDVHITWRHTFKVTGIYPRAIWGWITVVLWLFVGPRLLMGIWEGTRYNWISKVLVLVFILTLLSVTFVSFQARHRTMFIVFFPMLVGLGEKYVGKNSMMYRFLQISFALTIMTANIVSIG